MLNIGINFVIFFLTGFFVAHIFQITTKKWALWDKKIGWQLHHSIFGIPISLSSLFFQQHWVIFLAFGIGIIIEHTLKCGFVFIKKW